MAIHPATWITQGMDLQMDLFLFRLKDMQCVTWMEGREKSHRNRWLTLQLYTPYQSDSVADPGGAENNGSSGEAKLQQEEKKKWEKMSWVEDMDGHGI